MQNQLKNVLNISGDGFTVDANVSIRAIDKESDAKSNEHIFNIVNSDKLPEVSGQTEIYGKHITINQNTLGAIMDFNKDLGGVFDNKTVAHEALHTAGLIHPFEHPNFIERFFYDENELKQLNQPEENDPANVMNYGNGHLRQKLSRQQLDIMYDNYMNDRLNKDDK